MNGGIRRVGSCGNRAILLALGLFSACAGNASLTGEGKERGLRGSRPNFVFFLADDHAAHAISAYGSRLMPTPEIDRIAKAGIRFDRCFVTNSICAPSRAVFLTGAHSHVNGQLTNRERFDGSQPTFPRLLQAAGYRTALIGKWHLKSDPTGFDSWEILLGQGSYFDPRFRTPGGIEKGRGYTTERITDRAVRWLRSRRGREPFCLLIWHKAPHRNWMPAPSHLRDLERTAVPEPEDLFDDWAGLGPAARMQEMTVAKDLDEVDLKLRLPLSLAPEVLRPYREAYGPRNEAFRKAGLRGKELVRWKYQRYIKDYLRCVASLDEGVGRILDELEALGLRSSTMVVYSSDQGFFLGDHGWYDKRWMYEESMRTPLLISWPGRIPEGGSTEALVQNLDLAPTFLELAGVPVPPRMQGRSLVPWLEGREPQDWRDAVYYRYYEFPGWHSVRRHEGLRTARYKLIHYYGLGVWELFDLAKDPGEHWNLADLPAYRGLRRTLEHRLEALRRFYRVPEDRRPIPEWKPRTGRRPSWIRGGDPRPWKKRSRGKGDRGRG